MKKHSLADFPAFVPEGAATSEEERLRLRAYLLSEGYVIFPWQRPDGDWPYAKTPEQQEKRTVKSEFDEWLDGVTVPLSAASTTDASDSAVSQEKRRMLPW